MARAFHKGEALRLVKAKRDKAHEVLDRDGWVKDHWEAGGSYCLSGGINKAATGNHYSQAWDGTFNGYGLAPGIDEDTRYAVQALKRAVAMVTLHHPDDCDECDHCDNCDQAIEPALHNEVVTVEHHVPDPAYVPTVSPGGYVTTTGLTGYSLFSIPPIIAPKVREVRKYDARGTNHYDNYIVRWNDSRCTDAQTALNLLLTLPEEILEEAVEAEFPLCEPVRGLAAPTPGSLALAAGTK
jgi:hypothetical protein